MSKKIDLTGQRFGRLTILRFDHINECGFPFWEVRCDCCGNTKIVSELSLYSGVTTSCGCLHSGKNNSNYKDGRSKERLYHVWKGMLYRCFNKGHPCYQYYGGRGITVCDEWRNDYVAFRNWAMETGYDPDAPFGKCTIDRIDNNGNYEPSNCRWVTMAVQSKNKRPIHKKVTT